MPVCSFNREAIRISLFSLLITGLLLLFVSGASHPVLDPQLDDHGSPTLVSVDGSGDSASPEPSVSVSSDLLLRDPGLRAEFSSCLGFVQPPQRLLSFPELPQGPPYLA
ncbi:hypothetical protein MD273_12375 [Marinobacter pelagius]|uniref:hypothetical protein n=1 Tax=Marinobacter sp. C7 TaxID=2951363 RepID=UPI001EF016FB|nr:hypothetical protein [Marinobacter sp. C7]MCG7200520.1 hypothetical protein [Marinobacter sp. C7]